jgi:enoyl-CoA hydratase/carnithine racemase
MAPREDRVTIEISDAGIADVRLTRADKHNGLDWPMFEAINEAIDELEAAIAADPDSVRVVVLAGEGPSFCAGLDFKSFAGEDSGDLAGDGFERPEGQAANFAQRVAYGWRELPVPVIAVLRGASYGGGCQIALAADIRLAARDSKLSVMEIEYGLIPDMSITQTLPRLVGDDVARELVYTGQIVEAEEAFRLGLVTRVFDDPMEAARKLAAGIASKPPAAIRSAKRLLNDAWGASPEESLALESELQRALIDASQLAASVSDR